MREHGDERPRAWLLRGEDALASRTRFISTQYDGDGVPTRLGLELWPEEAERASRAAATRVAASALGRSERATPGRACSAATTDGSRGPRQLPALARDERARPDHHRDLRLRRRAHHAARPVVRGRPGRDRDPDRGARQGDDADRPRRTASTRSSSSRRGGSPRSTSSRSSATRLEPAARPPARAAPLQRDLLRGAPPEPADDRADARGSRSSGHRMAHADQQRARVGAALALDAAGRRDLRDRRRLRLRRLPQAGAARSTS